LLFFSKNSISEPREIHHGFLTGNTFLEMSESKKRGYAIGFIEAIFISPMFDNPKENTIWVEHCVEKGMTDIQVSVIFEKFLKDNPSRWHEQMHILAWLALKGACPNSQ
jgi:hypothetical protein